MTSNVTIVGAGMAGLLAANMLHRLNPVVVEAQPSLPNNHSAVLRFGSDKVADVLGIPFRKVQMIKTSIPWLNPVADSLMYSFKCGGIHRSDRSITTEVVKGDRWIAPPDLIERMAKGVKIEFGDLIDKLFLDGSRIQNDSVISTIPMPALMRLLNYPTPVDFKFVEGANLTFKALNADAYASLYIPDPEEHFNRISITGDEVIAEYAFPDNFPGNHINNLMEDKKFLGYEAAQVANRLGVAWEQDTTKMTPQRYAKIQPISDIERKKFMAWATDNHNIFSLGRYATWRPGLLLDDLVHDIRQIEKWITGDRWSMRMKR